MPLVSIICVTYNHEKYLAQTLDSFLMQQTDFPFEIIIHDDASTDGTRKIIEDYARKHHSIRPIYEKVNQYSKGNDGFINSMYALARGKYIAACEGDDFWTDTEKLQHQVDFLESHPDYSLCFHSVRVFFEDGSREDAVYPEKRRASEFTVTNLLRQNFIQSNSIMYRAQPGMQLPSGIIPLDWYTHLYYAQFGKIGFIDRVMSAYRRHSGGIWWDQHNKPELIWKKYGYNYLKLLHEMMKLYGDDPERRKVINNHIAGSYEAVAAIQSQDVADDVATRSIGEMPAETWDYIKHLMQQVDHYSRHDAYLQTVVDRETLTNQQLSDELHTIKASKAWKAVLAARSGKHAASRPINDAKRIVRQLRTKAKRSQK